MNYCASCPPSSDTRKRKVVFTFAKKFFKASESARVYSSEQMMEREARKAAEKAAKAEELKQATAATLQHRADLRREIVERHESMKAYRQALDAQSAWSQSQLLKCQER
ncbi:hypothetical protein Esti_001284 [Eimeria stiedai]